MHRGSTYSINQSLLAVPYTGADANMDLGNYNFSAAKLIVNGSNGAGALQLKQQTSNATAASNSTVLFADTAGDIKVKANLTYYATYKTSLNTGDRVYTFQDKNYTIADNADVAALSQAKVLPKVTTPITVLSSDSRATFTNEGAAALVVLNLPTAVANLTYTSVVQNANGIRLVAAAGDTIRANTAVSTVAGNISSTAIGSVITLTAINATEWIATSIVGTWTAA